MLFEKKKYISVYTELFIKEIIFINFQNIELIIYEPSIKVEINLIKTYYK